jgi:superfamily II DNA/RNA helicase
MLIAKLGLTCPKRLLTNLRAISNPNQILFANKSLFSLLKRDPINSTDSAQSSVPLDKYIKGEKTIETLQKKGINSFFPIQTKTYDYIYNGRDVIAGDKTGSGKTIAFTLPVIERLRHEQQLSNNQGIKFVVLAPTRELAVQIGAEINSLKNNRDDFQVITVYGGIPIGVNER